MDQDYDPSLEALRGEFELWRTGGGGHAIVTDLGGISEEVVGEYDPIAGFGEYGIDEGGGVSGGSGEGGVGSGRRQRSFTISDRGMRGLRQLAEEFECLSGGTGSSISVSQLIEDIGVGRLRVSRG